MLTKLEHLLRALVNSAKETRENDRLLEGLQIEGEMDEPMAYALLLTDLAMSDGNFDAAERAIIAGALQSLFPELAGEALERIETAVAINNSFRGPDSFIAKVKEEYSLEERTKLYNLIDKVIRADKDVTDLEAHLRNKFRKLLE